MTVNERECEDLLERYGKAMSLDVFGFAKTGEVFENAKRAEMEAMHGRYWQSDGEQRYMLRWAVEALEARGRRRRGEPAGEDPKKIAQLDHNRRNVHYPEEGTKCPENIQS